MIKLLRQLIGSRYFHLCIGILLLYGIAWAVTQTTIQEKILDSLRGYCMADYHLRESLFEQERMEAEFYRVRYRERLESLTAGLFDYRDKSQVQAFFLSRGFLYDAWEEGKGNHSYLLAEIVSCGRHEAEIPKRVAFYYLMLGKKRIKPFIEFKHGREARRLVSSGDEMIYIHRDRLDSLLRWYFDSLWQTEPKKLESHYIQWAEQKDPLTFFLYQDLKGICEDVFVKRLFSKKAEARDYFIEQGFNHFLPSLLAMAVRMAGDKDLPLHPEEKYLRALLSGLSEYPTYTLFYLVCKRRPYGYKPSLQKMWSEARSRFDFTSPETISLERISQVSHEILRRMEKMEQ
jgi:hypothetical protein